MQEQRNAFVVWLDDADDAPPPRCEGQVEHIRSATRSRFASAEELVRFLEAHRRRAEDAPER